MPPVLYAPVATLSIIAFGIPIAACIAAAGERRVVVLFLHSFLAGILALGLACQTFWSAGLSVHRAAPWLLATMLLANVAAVPVWRRVRSEGVSWTYASGLVAFIVVAVLTNAVYAVNDGKPYYGRAWGDQLNYSLLAHYLRVGAPSADAETTRPALALVHGINLLSDRIGQSLVHAWVAEITGGPELETFHATTVLAVLATTAVAFLIGLGIGVSSFAAALLAVAVAMAPPTQAIGLESFLSQAIGTPFVVYAVVVAFLWLSTERAIWLAALGASTAWVCIAYFEFLPVLLGAIVALLVAWRLVERPRAISLVAVCAWLAGGGGLGLIFNRNIITRIVRIGGLPGFEKFFPFAYSTEGLARLLVGDTVGRLGHLGTLVVAIGVLGLTASGVTGLLRARSRPRALALSVLALTVVPWATQGIPGEHSYQFYKLLQSFWPLVWLGLGLLLGDTTMRSAAMARRAGLPILIGLVSATIVVSAHMAVVEATGASPRSGINAYLRAYGTREMQALFLNRSESNLVVSLPDRRVYQDGLFNGVASLQLDGRFARMQAQWPTTGDDNVQSLDAALQDHAGDLLVLQIGSGYLRPSPTLFKEVAAHQRMHVYQLVGSTWLLARTILPQPLDRIEGRDDRIDAGNHPSEYVRLDFESTHARPEGIGIAVRYRRPANSALRFWHVYSNQQFGTVAKSIGDATEEDMVVLPSGPIQKGVTQVFFGPRSNTDASAVEPTSERATITSIVYGGPPPTP